MLNETPHYANELDIELVTERIDTSKQLFFLPQISEFPEWTAHL